MRRVVVTLALAAALAGAVTGAAVSAKATGVSVSPSSVSFGEVAVGTTAYADVTITNNTGKTVTNVNSDVPNSAVFYFGGTFTCYTLAPGATCTVQSEFIPRETKNYAGSMTLSYQEAGGKTWKVSWKLSGTGV